MYDLDEFKNDYNWREAFLTAGEDIDAVSEIICAEAGYNDEANWDAIVLLGSPYNYYAVISAGCDYTGWDCQAWCSFSEHYQDLSTAVSKMNLPQNLRESFESELREWEKRGRLRLDWDDEV